MVITVQVHEALSQPFMDLGLLVLEAHLFAYKPSAIWVRIDCYRNVAFLDISVNGDNIDSGVPDESTTGGCAMKRVGAVILIVTVMMLGMFYGADAATPEEAKAMVEKASDFLKENDTDVAFPEISNPQGQFVKGGLYAFVLDFKGVMLADGGNPGFIGLNLMGLKDTNGKYFVKEMIETAQKKGAGWVDYTWLNPVTRKIQPKTTYVKRIKGMDAFVGCGVLK
jgi:cytochrome c